LYAGDRNHSGKIWAPASATMGHGARERSFGHGTFGRSRPPTRKSAGARTVDHRRLPIFQCGRHRVIRCCSGLPAARRYRGHVGLFSEAAARAPLGGTLYHRGRWPVDRLWFCPRVISPALQARHREPGAPVWVTGEPLVIEFPMHAFTFDSWARPDLAGFTTWRTGSNLPQELGPWVFVTQGAMQAGDPVAGIYRGG
jgi:hypothetical protein